MYPGTLCIRVFIYVFASTCVYVHTLVMCMYTEYICVYVYTYAGLYTCTHVVACVGMCMYVCMYIYICTHFCTYIYSSMMLNCGDVG